VKQLRAADAEKISRETASGAKTEPAQLRRVLDWLDACVTVSTAIRTGLRSGSATGTASTRRMTSGGRSRAEGDRG